MGWNLQGPSHSAEVVFRGTGFALICGGEAFSRAIAATPPQAVMTHSPFCIRLAYADSSAAFSGGFYGSTWWQRFCFAECAVNWVFMHCAHAIWSCCVRAISKAELFALCLYDGACHATVVNNA